MEERPSLQGGTLSLQDLIPSDSPWVEAVVAALYLHGVEPLPEMFAAEHYPLVRAAWEQVRALPEAWAAELCLETLGFEDAQA